MSVKWTTNQTTGDQEGLCPMGQITLALITNSKICRSNCNSKHVHSYYVWHKYRVSLSLKQKKESMEVDNLWYLDNEWNKKNCSNYKVIKWLKCLSNIESIIDKRCMYNHCIIIYYILQSSYNYYDIMFML